MRSQANPIKLCQAFRPRCHVDLAANCPIVKTLLAAVIANTTVTGADANPYPDGNEWPRIMKTLSCHFFTRPAASTQKDKNGRSAGAKVLLLGLFSPESENINQKDEKTARCDCQKCGPNFGGYGLRPYRLDELLRIFKQAVYI